MTEFDFLGQFLRKVLRQIGNCLSKLHFLSSIDIDNFIKKMILKLVFYINHYYSFGSI